MEYKNKLKDKIENVLIEKTKIFKINIPKRDREYKLSYEIETHKNKGTTNNPREISFETFYKYVKRFYVEQDYIDIGKIENDLVVFKTYKEDMEISLANDVFLLNCLSILIAVFALIVAITTNKTSIIIGKLEKGGFFKALFREIENNNEFFTVTGLFTLACILLIAFLLSIWSSKSYFPNRIKSVNNVIFTLEAIKENLVEVPETRNFEVAVDSLIGEKSETRKYSVKVRESLEDKSK